MVILSWGSVFVFCEWAIDNPPRGSSDSILPLVLIVDNLAWFKPIVWFLIKSLLWYKAVSLL